MREGVKKEEIWMSILKHKLCTDFFNCLVFWFQEKERENKKKGGGGEKGEEEEGEEERRRRRGKGWSDLSTDIRMEVPGCV